MNTYIIATEQKDFLKIGKAKDVKSRFTQLRTATPYSLVLVGHFTTDIEAQLHREFARFRHKGEWFHYSIIEEITARPGFVRNAQLTRTRRSCPKAIAGERSTSRIPVDKKKITGLSNSARRLLTYALFTMDRGTWYVQIEPKACMRLTKVKSITTFRSGLAELLTKGMIVPDKQNTYYKLQPCAVPPIFRATAAATLSPGNPFRLLNAQQKYASLLRPLGPGRAPAICL